MTFSSELGEVISLRKGDHEETLTLAIVPTPKSAHHARGEIARFITDHHPCSEAAVEFMLAVGEALANAVEHGRPEEEIKITVRIRESLVQVVIEDRGCGFIPKSSVTTILPALDSERGRGLPLIAHCTDSFTIDSRPKEGTRVALSRNLHIKRLTT